MKNKSLFIKITILLSTLLVGIFTGQQAFADDGTIDIVIHKQLLDQAPDAAIQNTGAADQDIKDPIEGVGFTIYNITEDYYKLVKGSDETTTIQMIQENVADYQKIIRGQGLTDEKGIIKFPQLPKSSGGKNAVYPIVETALPDPEKVKVEKAAEPLVVALPVYEMSTDGKTYTNKELATVHLYPKNVGTIVEKPVTPTKPKKPSKPKKRLPQTGEAKFFLGILGILLIGTAIILWRKHSVRNN